MKVYSKKQLDEFEHQREEHKKNTEGFKKKLTFLEKIDNFFYHYKYHFLIIGFLVLATAYSIYLTVTSEKPDYELIIAAKKSQTSVDLSALTEELEAYGEDLNGDGKVLINITNCIIDGDVDDLQSAANATTIFVSEIETNQKIFYLVDDVRFKEMKEMLSDAKDKNLFVPINGEEKASWDGTKLQKNTKSGYDGEFYFVIRNVKGKNFDDVDKVKKNEDNIMALVENIINDK